MKTRLELGLKVLGSLVGVRFMSCRVGLAWPCCVNCSVQGRNFPVPANTEERKEEMSAVNAIPCLMRPRNKMGGTPRMESRKSN